MITFLAALVVFASLGIVVWPLLTGFSGGNRPLSVENSQVSELLAQKDATLFAISELESDYNMGNLSQGDYRDLRQKYEQKAVVLIKTVDELRSESGLDASHMDEEIEAKISQLRASGATTETDIEAQVSRLPAKGWQMATGEVCRNCGAQQDAGDLFCFRCGAALSARCPGCSAAVQPDDRFCGHCGTVLNAGGKARKAV
ncbi:MAG: zinc-ribbon domain-containing protein [Dehalococcoidales bacterium]|nr:zinc-ribbon domain-containing protein [Dehalococcoidales bacterium]